MKSSTTLYEYGHGEPLSAVEDVVMLRALELPIEDGIPSLERACRLAVELQQHLLDTLYHAIALETESTLITADQPYYDAGVRLGSIMRLTDWR